MGGSRGRSRGAGVAEEAARALFADLGRHRVCALLRNEHAIDYRHVDDRRLIALLAQAHLSGAPFLPADDAETPSRSEWITAPVRGLGRVMLSTARLKAGFTPVTWGDLPNPDEVVDALLSRPDSREVIVSFVGTGDVAVLPREASRGFGRPASDPAKPEDRALRAAFVAALLGGEVFLFRSAFESGEGVKTVAFDPTSKPKPLAKPAQTVLHWIEIALVDEDGAPLAGEPYQITLPDGDVRSGALDSAGKARLDGLTPSGSAQVSFPNIDGREWKLA